MGCGMMERGHCGTPHQPTRGVAEGQRFGGENC